jgi:hypothetical protein
MTLQRLSTERGMTSWTASETWLGKFAWNTWSLTSSCHRRSTCALKGEVSGLMR